MLSFPVARDLGYSLTQVNWLGNVIALTYLPVSLAIPYMVARFGVRRCVCLSSFSVLHF
jgi:MFS transporter, FLVCR family, MFS-domain-containing protein 7